MPWTHPIPLPRQIFRTDAEDCPSPIMEGCTIIETHAGTARFVNYHPLVLAVFGLVVLDVTHGEFNVLCLNLDGDR